MKKLLKEIQDGTFAKKWIEENKTGRKFFNRMRADEAKHPVEEVGGRLRAAMPFLDPVTVKDNTPQTEVATA
jgi:ketol-acid reductoisomerase